MKHYLLEAMCAHLAFYESKKHVAIIDFSNFYKNIITIYSPWCHSFKTKLTLGPSTQLLVNYSCVPLHYVTLSMPQASGRRLSAYCYLCTYGMWPSLWPSPQGVGLVNTVHLCTCTLWPSLCPGSQGMELVLTETCTPTRCRD